MVLGVEEELNGVTDISTDVARAVHQLTTWADLNRMRRGGIDTSGCRTGSRTGGGVGRQSCGSIVITVG